MTHVAQLGIALAAIATLAVPQATDGLSSVNVSTTAELERALAEAKPGVVIYVAAGDYNGFHASNIIGDAGHPIAVWGVTGKSPPVFRGSVHLSDVAYVVLANLVFEGAPSNGLNIDDGGSFETPSHHVELFELFVRDCGGRGNDDGIKLSGVDDFRLKRCNVARWGRGGSAVDMVGCHRGRLESCRFEDREQDCAATGVQIKGGSRDVNVYRCRFDNAGERAVNIGGSTGLEYFRPKPEGFEAKDIVVEGCTFVGSTSPIAFVGVVGAVARFNTLYRPRKWCARILQETREPGFVWCREGKFTDNLIAYRSDELSIAVNVGPDTASGTFEFARNYWFCIDDPARERPKLPRPEIDPGGGSDPQFLDVEQGDFGLRPMSPARSYGANALLRDNH